MTFEQRIQKEIERFQILVSRLSDTQWSEAAMPDAQSRLTTCQRQIRLIQMKINTFNAIADKEHKRFIDLKKHSVTHAWFRIRGTLLQSLNEQEKTWLREFKKYKEEEQYLFIIKEETYSAQKHLHQCRDAYEQYITNRRELNELLDHFFSGITPFYPEEDELKQKLVIQEQHLITLQNDDRILKHVYHLLKKAYRAISISHHAFHHALTIQTSNLFVYYCFGNILVGSYLSKARDASTQAQKFLNEAKCVYSNIPLIDNLCIEQNNSVFNIMCDHLWIDRNMRKMISERSNRITYTDAVLVSILLQIKKQIEKCDAERNETSKDIKRLAAEYLTTRITIVQNIIESLPSYAST